MLVAVLATGVQGDRPDLEGKVTAWRNIVEPDRTPSVSTDANGHGTMVASLVAAGDASGEASRAQRGRIIRRVVDHFRHTMGARARRGRDRRAARHALHEPLSFVARTVEVLDGFGVVVVCAAGNVPDTVSALGNTPLAITVGATDRRDQIAAFSGRGTVRVGNDVIVKPDLIAPGVNVPAANGEGWRSISGTSTSVGLAGGAVALLLSATSIHERTADAELTETVRRCLYASAVDLGGLGKDSAYGRGLIDVYAAIREAWTLGFAP